MDDPMPADAAQVSGNIGAQLRDARLAHVHRYWASRCGLYTCPLRQDIDPRALKPVLPFVFMAERGAVPGAGLSGGPFRLRLVGTALVGLFGRDVTGCLLSEALAPAVATEVAARFESVLQTTAPTLWHGIVDRGAGSQPLAVQSLNLPLSSDGTCVDRILGAMVFGPALPAGSRTPDLRRAS
ncbi:PAS domain-containing protein [Zavarzinia sp. CC-PAN008]|uniref:PAS domain-containing protein n=1 Tax=Zavarzinia sp. CC-PAN008 TaxID=3243332 RepID=UPI003F749238